jgi:hypothetical protein
MQAQQMGEAAVQRARENKANDFKMMMAALDKQGDREYQRYLMTKGDDALKVQTYNAQTSRYNALNNRGGSSRDTVYMDDVLGIGSGGGGGGSSARQPVMPPPVLPGSEGDFVGGAPGPSGTFGDDLPLAAASPGDYSLLPTVPPPLPEGDEGPTGPSGPAPAAVVSPRAIPLAEPVELPSSAPVVPPAAPVAEVVQEQESIDTPAGDLTSQQTLRAFMGPTVPPAPADTAAAPLLPPPVVVPSFTDQDVSTTARSSVVELEGASKEEARRAAILQAKANQTAGYLSRGMVRDRAAGSALAEQQQAEAIDAARKANEAAAKADTLKTELPKLQKRQEILSSLTDLETVLPPEETASLIQMAADPVKGGQADRQLSVLSAYQKVRQERSLTHKSRGLASAELVARAGASLYTKEAQDDRQAFESNTEAKAALASAAPESDEAKAWRTEEIKTRARARAWENREKTFEEAVRRDKLPDAPVAEAVTVNPVAPVVPAAEKPADIISQGDQLRKTAKPTMTPAESAYWTTAKNAALVRIGGKEGIVKAISETRKPVASLDDLKRVIRGLVVPLDSPDMQPEGSFSTPPVARILPNLPKNARNYGDVADALATDLWEQTGRPADGKAVPGAPAVNPGSRSAIDDLKAKIDSTR